MNLFIVLEQNPEAQPRSYIISYNRVYLERSDLTVQEVMLQRLQPYFVLHDSRVWEIDHNLHEVDPIWVHKKNGEIVSFSTYFKTGEAVFWNNQIYVYKPYTPQLCGNFVIINGRLMRQPNDVVAMPLWVLRKTGQYVPFHVYFQGMTPA